MKIVKEVQKEDQKLYQCEECGFRYEEKEWAEKCQAWCRKHHTCNLEIIQHALENKNSEVKK